MTMPMPRMMTFLLTILVIGRLHAGAPVQTWARQLGTAEDDFAHALAVDATGNCHLAGYTCGDLAAKNAGKKDILIGKFDAEGKQLWLAQLGSADDDEAKSIAVDAAGAVFVAGSTSGKLGDTHYGKKDAFVAKLDAFGKLLWLRQFGTAANEAVQGLAIDKNGCSFVTGFTTGKADRTELKAPDIFVSKFDANGTLVWTRQWGTEEGDFGNKIALDTQGNVYVTGATGGDLHGHGKSGKLDVFISKLAPSGREIWCHQFGTTDFDNGMNLLIDPSGLIIIGGSSAGDFAAAQLGQGDSILMKLSADGALIWKRQFGTANWDGIHGLVFSPAGSGSMVVGGCEASDQCQAFLRGFDADGRELWQTKIDAKQGICGTQVGTDRSGNIYQVGGTHGPAFGPYAGKGNDIILVKFAPAK